MGLGGCTELTYTVRMGSCGQLGVCGRKCTCLCWLALEAERPSSPLGEDVLKVNEHHPLFIVLNLGIL